jgi:hypothetical protein
MRALIFDKAGEPRTVLRLAMSRGTQNTGRRLSDNREYENMTAFAIREDTGIQPLGA